MSDHLQKLYLIDQLPLCKDINNHIKIMYKYSNLQIKYKKTFNELNKHYMYYCWLNKKINKKGDKQTLLQTIKEYDYYPPIKHFKVKYINLS